MIYEEGVVVQYIGDDRAREASNNYPGFMWNPPEYNCIGILVGVHTHTDNEEVKLYSVRVNIMRTDGEMDHRYYAYYDFEVEPI